MRFVPTTLRDAFIVELERHGDERGFFARTWCQREFENAGLRTDVVQANLSRTALRGSVRGMHLQLPPHAETKLVRCVRGAAWDVIVDLRPESPTYLKWEGFEISPDNGRAVYVPEGFGHGFQTLTDDVDVFYQVTGFYAPGAERGLRFDEPALGIEWPEPVTVVSDKDQSWPVYAPFEELRDLAPGGSRAGERRCC